MRKNASAKEREKQINSKVIELNQQLVDFILKLFIVISL